ncbi:MAG: hypothetical protein KQI62_07300 [Deltaproteobacteria bacterium]|nr:hypothetical protein [Deltaproteobacteria bacterium]
MSLLEFRVWLLDDQGNNQDREVIINSRPSARYTGEIIYKEAGHHRISLVDPPNFSPEEQEIALSLEDEEIREVEFNLED